MALRLLPKSSRDKNRKRWSFRLGSLTTFVVGCVAIWNMTPDTWHPQLNELGRYAIMGTAFTLAILANAAHLFDQPSLNTDTNDSPQPPAKTNAGMSTQ